MKRLAYITRRLLVPIVLLALAFVCGWHAFPYWHSVSQRQNIALAYPLVLPGELMTHSFPATPETASFAVGDRIDILADINGELRPLVIDALVVENSKGFQLLMPRETGRLINWAIKKNSRLEFGITKSLSPPDYEKKLRMAREELDRQGVDVQELLRTLVEQSSSAGNAR